MTNVMAGYTGFRMEELPLNNYFETGRDSLKNSTDKESVIKLEKVIYKRPDI